jgi:hypothetical protein
MPSSRLSNTIATGVRVPLNTHAPLTFPGTLSTGHSDQSSTAIVFFPRYRGRYPGGVTVTDGQLATVRLERHHFHGDWNYTVRPSTYTATSSTYFLTAP